jgi:hypothetical protein
MFSIVSSENRDPAGLAPPRRSNLASVAVELIHDSRQEDGCGRLGNYSDCLKHDRENYTLLAGYPRAHEDDAERAIRAGLAVVGAVRKLPAREDLRVRLGIATGLALSPQRKKEKTFEALAY